MEVPRFQLTLNNVKLIRTINNQDINEVRCILGSRVCSVNGGLSGLEQLELPIIQCVRSCNGGFIEEEDAVKCEILKLLVKSGADINVKSSVIYRSEETAAILAARQGFFSCLDFLVETGADLSITNKFGDTALMAAVRGGQAECVTYLTKHVSFSVLNKKNEHGETALHVAVSRDDIRNSFIPWHLIEAGIDLNATDRDGQTALMLALETSRTEVWTLLLEKGALVNTVTHSGRTPLSLDSSSIVRKLLRRGLDPTLSRRDQPRLKEAVESGQDALVRGLVMHGFPPLDLWTNHNNIFLQDKPISPLAVAILSIRPDIAKYLILNRFMTRYDLVQLCWDKEIITHLNCSGHARTSTLVRKSRECLDILDFLSTSPQSLRDLCLIAISSALSQDFALDIPDTVEGKDNWICKPTFRERVEFLQIPPVFKKALLHQTLSSAICCHSWGNISLGEENNFRACHCQYCEG
ncbi:ankyrin repeat-containing protein [Elysia marginata]|uniref:Ankyrin repeat-containing protein n=1 Tax=Elysia marginata TaxID=1093978 RepID=A0AAV4F723_9GAST|nr:ankyrin repeat-containing protein [Elysia marginata]